MDTILDVKIVSSETVKPSVPTPSHLKHFTLSMLDKVHPAIHISALIFYNPTTQIRPLDITRLKTSLSETLSRFYPLAGRCIDDSIIICNDEGVPFIEAHVNCVLADLLNSQCKLDLVRKLRFCPSRDLLATGKQHISELVQLAFQINVFNCGGFVFGCYMLHKIMDSLSLGLFFRHWSALAREKYDDELIAQPDFSSAVVSFPPDNAAENLKPMQAATPPDVRNFNIVGKGFLFNNLSLRKLRAMSASKSVPNPTRFEAVIGFIWEQALAAEAAAAVTEAAQVEPECPNSTLIFNADMRKRVSPPISEGSIGNLVVFSIASGKKGSQLPELVAEIHGNVSRLKDEISTFQGQNGATAIVDQRLKVKKYAAGYRPGTFLITSWCQNGLSKADFGFGKPTWIVPVSDGIILPAIRNLINVTDYNDPEGGEGIAAWMFLEEKEMQALESNQQVLDFTSQW